MLSEKIQKDLLNRFCKQRDEEYAELIECCDGLQAKLARETKNKKFSFAKLGEDELRKLESWLARIKARDHIGRAREPSRLIRCIC